MSAISIDFIQSILVAYHGCHRSVLDAWSVEASIMHFQTPWRCRDGLVKDLKTGDTTIEPSGYRGVESYTKMDKVIFENYSGNMQGTCFPEALIWCIVSRDLASYPTII